MKPETSSTNIHVFRVNRTVQNKQSQTQSSNSATSSSSATLTVNSRTSLSAKTKRQICQDHLDNPRYTQEALAFKYGCKRTTVAKIIKSKERWLAIDSDTATAKRFRQRSSRYPLVENALILWLEKEQHDLANVTNQMLRCQARQYAQRYSVEGLDDFKASSSWVTNFKQKYLTLKIKENRSDAPSYRTPVYRNRALPSSGHQESKTQTFTSVFPVGPPANHRVPFPPTRESETIPPDIEQTVIGTSVNDNREHFIVEQWGLPANSTIESAEASQEICAIDEPEETFSCSVDSEEVKDDDMPDFTDDYDNPYDFDMKEDQLDTNSNTPTKIDNESSTDNELTTRNTKLDAKKHLEAALSFYTSQAGTGTSVSANMIKLILQNDFGS